MLGLVDSFSDKWFAFLWEQTVPHYWLTCFSIPTKMSFQINSLRRAEERFLESSICHTVILMTLSLSITKDLRIPFLIFTPKKSQFLKPQNLLQLLMIRSGHRRLARLFNLCYRYIDDLIVFNNKKFLDYLKEIYPSQLTVEKANKSDHLADYLDLTFIIDSGGKLSTRLYDKRDDFDFHIVNFPFLSSNIPSGPSYGVYISQVIRYA